MHHGQLTPEHDKRKEKMRADKRGRGEIRKYSLKLSTTGTIIFLSLAKCNHSIILCETQGMGYKNDEMKIL